MLIVSACAARQPSEARATRLVERHFAGYAKDYPSTIYGTNPVTEASILQIQEIHKGEVVATADLLHQDGSHSLAQCVLDRVWPRGWRFQAWERLGTQ